MKISKHIGGNNFSQSDRAAESMDCMYVQGTMAVSLGGTEESFGDSTELSNDLSD